ncbi:hypothetical protein G7046_g8964 [Stylonectria norvegica]|nr:hypothetical protein G7046_g8964 [Stylonectria norvegica]
MLGQHSSNGPTGPPDRLMLGQHHGSWRDGYLASQTERTTLLAGSLGGERDTPVDQALRVVDQGVEGPSEPRSPQGIARTGSRTPDARGDTLTVLTGRTLTGRRFQLSEATPVDERRGDFMRAFGAVALAVVVTVKPDKLTSRRAGVEAGWSRQFPSETCTSSGRASAMGLTLVKLVPAGKSRHRSEETVEVVSRDESWDRGGVESCVGDGAWESWGWRGSTSRFAEGTELPGWEGTRSRGTTPTTPRWEDIHLPPPSPSPFHPKKPWNAPAICISKYLVSVQTTMQHPAPSARRQQARAAFHSCDTDTPHRFIGDPSVDLAFRWTTGTWQRWCPVDVDADVQQQHQQQQQSQRHGTVITVDAITSTTSQHRQLRQDETRVTA